MRRRSAYTLLEVLLAMAIAILLLAALYSAVGYQLRQAQAGRELVEQAALARGVFNRITNDAAATAALCDPGRFRNQQNQQNNPSASAGGGASGGGASGGGASGQGGSTGGATTNGGSGSTTNGSSSSTTTTTSQGTAITFPMGVMGDATTLHLWTSRMPTEVWPADQNDQGVIASDVRRISYWLDSEGDGGLCRYEYKVVTSQDATNISLPPGEAAAYNIAPEVKSVEFSYFDGTNWQDTWDSTTLGADGVTPIGSPRAISVKVGFLPHGVKPSGSQTQDLKYYRHVISVATANGTAAQTTNQPGSTSGQGSTTGSQGSTGGTSGK